MSNLAVIGVVSGLVVWVMFALASMNIIPQSHWRHWYHGRDSSPVSLLYLIAFLVGLSALIFAWLGYRNGEDFYANLATECASVAVTIFVINRLYDRRSKLEEKQRRIEELRSPSAEFAKEALRIVTEKGWSRDGSLKGADLKDVNLAGADLAGADLRGADLAGANLMGAYLSSTNQLSAYLWSTNQLSVILGGADLRGADLWFADLRGADLRGADLTGANLRGATYNDQTDWPEGYDPVAAGALLEK